MTVGENIRRLREAKGMKQDELAEALGVTAGAVSLWESNKRSMNVKQADKLAQVLGVTLNDIVDDKE